jgi:hypothetical protein
MRGFLQIIEQPEHASLTVFARLFFKGFEDQVFT